MTSRIPLFALLLLLSAGASASGGGHGSAAPAEDAAKLAPGTPFVDLPPLMAPMTVDGELKFYVYMVLKLELTSDFKKPIVLEKVPYLQDAILRAVHATSIVSAQNQTQVDEPALLARLKPVVVAVLGADVISDISFRSISRQAN